MTTSVVAHMRKQWIDALRSGEYAQCTLQLRSEANCYCVFGVLCDLAAKRGVGEWVHTEDGYGFRTRPSISTEPTTLFNLIPFEIKQLVGLTQTDASRIMSLNDNGWTFEKLAQHLEITFNEA